MPRYTPLEVQAMVLAFVQKPYLLACALTCRAWLQLCAARLFESVYLRSTEDFHLLQELPKTYLQSYVFTYLQCVTVHFQITSTSADRPMPLFDALSITFPRMKHVRYICDSAERQPESTPRSSPHRSPYSQRAIASKGLYKHLLLQSSNISILQLSGFAFHSLTDLLRICGALHSLAVLHLRAVTWQHTPRALPITRGLYHCLREVQAYQCTSELLFLWLWSSLGSTRNSGKVIYEVHYSDLHVIVDIAQRLQLIRPDSKVIITRNTMANQICECSFNSK